MNRAPTGRFVAAIVLGLLLGGILGECFGFFFGWVGELAGAGWDNNLRNLCVQSFDLDLGWANPLKIDLNLVKFSLGLGIKFNLMSVLGMGLAVYVEKWSRSK